MVAKNEPGMTLRPTMIALLLAIASGDTPATVWQVDDLDDAADAQVGDGVCAAAADGCTLRAAIQEANAHPGFDEVRVPAGAYFLELQGAVVDDSAVAGDLDIREPMLLRGEPDAQLVQIGDDFVLHSPLGERVFDVDTGNAAVAVRFEQVFVEFGKAHDALGGGGILVRAGSRAEIDRSVIYANGADVRGNAIAVYGTLTVTRSHVFDNHVAWSNDLGEGGGAFFVAPSASLTLSEVAIDSNTHCHGGSILARGPSTVEIVRSTLRGDHSTDTGCVDDSTRGDLLALNGAVQMSVTDSTLSESLEALYATTGAQVSFTQVTLAGESFFGDLALEDAATSLTIANSIIGRRVQAILPCSAPAGAIVSLGGNVFQFSAPCAIVLQPGDQVASNLGLAPLSLRPPVAGFAVESREVFSPTPGSVVIDAALEAHCGAIDEAGSNRPVSGAGAQPAHCDAGAIEWPPTHLGIDGFE